MHPTRPTPLEELMELTLEERIAAIANNLDAEDARYSTIAAHDLAEAFEIDDHDVRGGSRH